MFNISKIIIRHRFLVIAAVTIAAAACLSGCGGGGSVGTSSSTTSTSTESSSSSTNTSTNTTPSSPTTNDTIAGTVTYGGTTPAYGLIVKYNRLTAYKATTGPTGAYTLSIPTSAVTGSDQVWVYSTSGEVIGYTSVTLSGWGGKTTTVTTTLQSPGSPPPSGLIRR